MFVFLSLNTWCELQGFGPAFPPAGLMRRRHDLHLHLLFPMLTRSCAGKAFIDDVATHCRQTGTRQAGDRRLSRRKQRCRQNLIMTTGRAEAKAGNYSQERHAQQQMEAFIPAQAVPPANVGLASQPARSASFGIPGDGGGTIEQVLST